MSRRIIIPGVTFTGPKLANDPVLNSGSLVLVDINHPFAPMTSVPPSGSTITNIASVEARALLGAASAVDTYPLVKTRGTVPAVALTAKGSLQLDPGGSAGGWAIQYPMAIIQYLKANPTHQLGATLWCGASSTATASATGSWTFLTTDVRSVNDRGSFRYSRLTVTPDNTVSVGGTAYQTIKTTSGTGPRRISVSSGTQDANDATETQAQGASLIFGSGLASDYQSPIIPNNWDTKIILHRFYLEDLTVSGRTLDALDSADAALYATAFAAGGRYSATEYAA